MLEFAFENAAFFWGMRIGYGSPKTLFDAFMHGCKGDLQELCPSFLIGAPAIWEAIKKAILVKLEGLNNSVGNLISAMVLPSEDAMPYVNGSSQDESLRSTISEVTHNVVGSRLRFGMSGGGPIAPSTQRFLSTVMAPLINGFGLTETMA